MWEPGDLWMRPGFQTQSLGLCCNSRTVTARWWCVCPVMETVQSCSIVWTELSWIFSRMRQLSHIHTLPVELPGKGFACWCSTGQCWAGRDSPAHLSPVKQPQCALPVDVCMLNLPWEGQPSPWAGSFQFHHKQPCYRGVTPRDCTEHCWLCWPEFAWAVHICLDGVHCIFRSVCSTPDLHR